MRTSPVYYIAPSSISIIPNCNGTTSDLAVTIARGTKLKVYYPSIFALGTVDGNYQEWTLAGRNRRLADSTAPYTIYARLRMAEDPTSAASLATAHANGYLIFAKQTKDADGNWTDPYILSPNPSSTSPLNNVMGANGKKYSWPPIPAGQAQNGRTGYWWLKLGVVSAPENGKRTVTLDTGILDTAQYNEEWKINPDDLPVRPVRDIQVDRKEWTTSPKDIYTGETGSTAPDGTLAMDVASKLGWTGTEMLSFTQGQEIDEPYHYRSLTRNRWLTQRLDIRNSGYNDKELYERLTSPARGWEEENWVETSRVWHNSSLWECQKDGTTDEPSEDSAGWRLLMRGGADGEDGDSGYSVELTKSSDSAIIDPSGNVVGGYRTVSIGKDDNGRSKEFYSYRFFTSAAVMKGGEYLHLCGAMDDDEELGDGNFTIEAIGAGCDLKMEGTTCYITGIWHCNDGNAETPNTSYSENPEEYQLMRAMTECVAHITLNIEGKTAVTKDYRLQLVHLPTDTVVIESHNEVAAVNWSTKKNAWTNPDSIVIPLTASSGGQPVRFQTVNGEEGPDIRILNKPTWLEGFSLAWADYKDGTGNVLYPASQHMAVEITIPIANIKKNQDIKTSNLLRFNVVTTVDGVEYENIVPFTLNMTTDKAIYVLAPSVRQVVGTMIGGTWDEQAKDVANARYSYTANGASCNNVSCRLMSYDENNALTEITNASDIHDNVAFLLNGQPSSLAAFRAGLSNTAVSGKDHNLFDELSEIVFAIRLDDNDYESEGVPILRNGAQLTVGSDGYWYIGGVKTEVFAKGTEVTDTKIYYTDPMTGSTPPPYSPEDDQRGLPVSPYLKTECPASVEGKFIHYVSITVFSDSDKTFVYSYGTIGTGNTITVIHDRDYYASPSELEPAQLKAIEEWSESTPADYSATNKYLYARDTARYYKNGAEQTVTVGGIAYPKIVYNLLSYWGQDGSGVEFAYYRADDDSAANKPSVSVLNQRHPGTAKNPVIADWNGSDGGWYDDNPGFTAQGQVMYQSVNKYSNGQWSGWDDPVIIDRYAQNSVRLALDNEHEDFLYDGTTLVAPSAGASSPIRLYDGGKDVTSSMPAPEIHSVSGTTNGTGGAYISNKTLYVKALTTAACEVVVKCVYNGTAYYAKFTANKTNQDKYDLVCKPSSVAYNSTTHAAKADNATIQTVSLSATGIGIGGTSLSPSLSTSVGAGRLCVFWAPVSSSGTVGSFSASPVTSKAVTKLECENYAGIYFELRYYTNSSDYRVCDYETVEIAKAKDGEDGKDGEDAKYIYIRGTGRNNDAQRILNITSTTNVFSEYGSRGFVAARINRSTLAVSGITWFDVYGGLSEGSWTESDANANTARTRFVTYLANTTSDYFLAVASQDAIGLNDAMVAKLREFGLGELDYTAVSGVGGFRTPFAFLGYKGLQQGYALYQLQGTGENDPYAEVMAYVSNGIFMSSKDGDDAVNYDIVFTEAWAKAAPDGTISARLRGYAYKIEGNNRTPLAYATVRYGYNTEDIGTYADTTTNNQGYFDEDTWFDGDELDDYAKGSAAVFASIIIDGRAVCTKFVTIVQEAADGKPGHVGRWYYYAGDWASGATYTMQETQAPFVKRGDNFYMLDYGNSGAKTGTTQLDPASNYNPVSGQGSKPWTLMQSTMQYYIAQAFFGPYAHFGSFIINGDWMISQYGTLVYSSGTTITVNASNVSLTYGGKVPYAWFDPTDPTASSNPSSGSYKFIPNFAVDGLTGKTYQNDAYVRGEITATGGSITGYLDMTGGLNVKNSGGSTIVQVNGGTASKTASNSITIVDAEGFYVKRNNEGFRLTTNGFQRWNPSENKWVNFYGGRYAKIVALPANTSIYASKDDDLIIVKAYSNTNTFLYLPNSGISDGKVISIINAGSAAFEVHGNGNKILAKNNEKLDMARLNTQDRFELVYVSGYWYANYMSYLEYS